MTDQAAAADTNAPQDQAADTGSGSRHVVVAGAALVTMAFVLGLWMVRGGSVDMLLGKTPDVATTGPAAVQQTLPVTASEPRTLPTPMVQVTPPAAPQAAETPQVAETQPGQPAAATAYGTPVYVVPQGAVNPLTMLHDPAYYQQWARVGATFANPFAYQQIMNLMMQHAMQAWGMGPPVTVSVDAKRAPRG